MSSTCTPCSEILLTHFLSDNLFIRFLFLYQWRIWFWLWFSLPVFKLSYLLFFLNSFTCLSHLAYWSMNSREQGLAPSTSFAMAAACNGTDRRLEIRWHSCQSQLLTPHFLLLYLYKSLNLSRKRRLSDCKVHVIFHSASLTGGWRSRGALRFQPRVQLASKPQMLRGEW